VKEDVYICKEDETGGLSRQGHCQWPVAGDRVQIRAHNAPLAGRASNWRYWTQDSKESGSEVSPLYMVLCIDSCYNSCSACCVLRAACTV